MNEPVEAFVDPTANHALRVYVERVVRPIRAEESEKLRMRNELYGHTLAAYEEQLAGDQSCDEAARQAIGRMGDAAELAAELQAGVPWWSRWAAWVDRLVRRRPETPRWRYAAWIASVGLVEMATLLALIGGLAFLGVIPQKANNPEVLGRLTALLVVLFAFNLFHGAYLGCVVRDKLVAGGTVAGRIGRVIGFALCGGLLMFGSGTVLWWLVGWPEVAPTPAVAACWATLSVIFVVGEVIVPWLDVRERRGLDEWLALQIE